MAGASPWTKEAYEASATSRYWGGTPYSAGWDGSKQYGEDLPQSAELRAIFEEEMQLGDVPDWACEILGRMVNDLPMCGHYSFPLPLLQICSAICDEKCPRVVVGCYTADSERKTLMSYYVFCLDAWLKEAPLELAAEELKLRDDLGKDWPAIIAAIYDTLGERSEAKRTAIERLVHRLRWWIKTLIWFDDRRDKYLLDVYSGDVRGDEAKYGAYGNSPYGDPFFAELSMPQVVALEERIRGTTPDGDKLCDRIRSTWLCAPKVFRYVEKLIVQIGSQGCDGETESDGAILQCEDTYPDVESHEEWYASFMSSLTKWLDGDGEALPELGQTTPVKHWIARILRRKLRLYERYNSFGNMVGARPSGRSGEKAIS